MTKRKKPEADFPVNLDNVPITNKMLSLATSELNHSIYALDYKIEAQFKGIDARLIEMDAKWEARLNAMDAKWEARLNAMDAKLDAMQARSDAHFKDLKGLVEVIAKKVADTLLLTEQQNP